MDNAGEYQEGIKRFQAKRVYNGVVTKEWRWVVEHQQRRGLFAFFKLLRIDWSWVGAPDTEVDYGNCLWHEAGNTYEQDKKVGLLAYKYKYLDGYVYQLQPECIGTPCS